MKRFAFVSTPLSRAVMPFLEAQWRHIPSALRLVLGLVLLIIVGTLLLMLPIAGQGDALTFDEAVFTAVSALTVTGLSIITPINDLSLFGQITLLLLIQMGGVGFMVLAVFVLRLLGRRVSVYDRLTLSDSLGLMSPAAILKVSQRVVFVVLALEALGALALWLHWRQDPRLSAEQALFFALFHAVSAFCNAGFDLFTGLPGYPEGLPRDNITLSILGALIVVGGLGIPVLTDLITYPLYRRISLHTRLTLLAVVVLIVIGGVGILLAESRAGSVLAERPLGERLIKSFFQSISARTAGFAGVADFAALTPATQVLMTALMFIGCAPASMGGGITTGTAVTLVLGMWAFARGQETAVFGRRALAVGTVRKAAVILTISLLTVTLATWLILMTHDTTMEKAVFEVVSAFATCGLTLNFTTELNPFGRFIIMLMMFWGRLGALTIVIAVARQSSRAAPRLVQYPEEQILIG
jgi:trk system potassium uptake protein TrkH